MAQLKAKIRISLSEAARSDVQYLRDIDLLCSNILRPREFASGTKLREQPTSELSDHIDFFLDLLSSSSSPSSRLLCFNVSVFLLADSAFVISTNSIFLRHRNSRRFCSVGALRSRSRKLPRLIIALRHGVIGWRLEKNSSAG